MAPPPALFRNVANSSNEREAVKRSLDETHERSLGGERANLSRVIFWLFHYSLTETTKARYNTSPEIRNKRERVYKNTNSILIAMLSAPLDV